MYIHTLAEDFRCQVTRQDTKGQYEILAKESLNDVLCDNMVEVMLTLEGVVVDYKEGAIMV